MKQIERYEICAETDYDGFLGDDVIRLIRRELAYFPNSCFSKLCIEWYNATYVALGEAVTVGCESESIEPTVESLEEDLFNLFENLPRKDEKKELKNLFKLVEKRLKENDKQEKEDERAAK